MDTRHWLWLLTCAGMLALAVVSTLRLRASPMAPPLAALCTLVFVVRFAGWAFSMRGGEGWPYSARLAYPLLPPVAFQFVVAFVGMRRRLRKQLFLLYASSVLLSGVAATGAVSARARAWAVGPAYEVALSLLMALCASLATALLFNHLREQRDVTEKLRTQVLMAVGALGLCLAAAPHVLPGAHILQAMVMLLALLLLSITTLGLRLFEAQPSKLLAVYVGALSLMATGGYVVASRLFASHWPFLVLASAGLSLCFLALLYEGSRAVVLQQARAAHLVTLGRWSAAMAHDLKNPIATLKGIGQFLLEERAQGRSIDAQDELIALVVSEADRMAQLVARYQSLGGAQPFKQRTCLNELVEASLKSVCAAAPHLNIEHSLEPSLPKTSLDRQRISAALENVLHNSVEALPTGGLLRVRTQLVVEPKPRVLLEVLDHGCGMNPRQVEQAFVETFSSKGEGRGLGLALVKSALDAHGGEVWLESRLGSGTRVVLSLPCEE